MIPFNRLLHSKVTKGLQGLLTLRVAALYRHVKWVVWPLWVTYACFLLLRIALSLYGNMEISSELAFSQLYQQTDFVHAESIMPSPVSGRCIVGNTNFRPTNYIVIPALFDVLLLALTVFKAIRSPATLREGSIVCVNSWLIPCGILR